MRVLVADREPSVRSALRLLVVQDGAARDVLEVGTAEDLLDQVQTHQPALLIVDWEMLAPEHAQRLAAVRHAASHIRVIVISPRAEHRDLAMAVGSDAFVCKTESPTRLREELRRVALSREGGIAA